MTLKQAQALTDSVYFHWFKLQDALNKAHHADLIKYDDYQAEGPCSALTEVKNRFEATTSNQVSEIFHKEARKKQWNR